jgi:hypothetical protein
MTDLGSAMGMGGPVLPYAGRFGGFMPYRMGGGSGSSLSFQPRGDSGMITNRTSFRLSSMSGSMSFTGGMSSMSSGMGSALGSGSGALSGFGSSGGMGLGGGMSSMPGGRGLGVMPPSFGYPFRQPPSLLGPSSGGAGMSM